MPAATSITRQTVGKTFLVAASILAIAALVQIGGLAWIFHARFRTSPPATGTELSGLAGTKSSFDDPFAETGPAGPSGPMASIVQPKAGSAAFPFKPVPISPEVPTLVVAPEESTRFSELLEQARTLRDRGDLNTALTRFREAQVLEPENPAALAEMATTYEKMAVPDKAAEQWRRIYDMGEAAGVYYTAAEAKMKASQANALLQTMPSLAAANAANSAANAASTVAASSEPMGLSAASKLGIGAIKKIDENDPTVLQKFILRIPVKAKPRARIDVRDIVIQVLFYDVLNARTLEKTNAQITTRWTNPPPDFSDEDTEALEVTYTQAIPPQGEAIENRKFYGYLVRVYYKDALQDARAEPLRLGQQLPAPRILQPDSTP